MTRQLNMAGKNSNEIYTLLYPNNLINFCRYDFTPFMNHCTDLCRLANRTGEFSVDDVYSIRNSISGCHKYYEQNMRTTFEKIVVDCWIDYLCKQGEVSVSVLWQSFMRCKNDFEKAVFSRLSEYRHNRAINEWTNLLKLQEYARRKTDFVFGVKLGSPAEASARANYFDLMFNVAANEQGFSVSEIGAACVFSAGRVPNSPFILSSASREILRNVLNDMDDAGSHGRKKPNPELSDQTAMEAFDIIKQYIPDKNDSIVSTIIKSVGSSTQKIYMPCSFKSAIDLEIDAIIESGGYLQRCRRCGEFFLKDEDYPHDYCSRSQKDGTVCLDFADTADAVFTKESEPFVLTEEAEEPVSIQEPLDKTYVNEKLEALYKEMAARVNVDMTQQDFSRWYQQELRLKELILFGQAGEEELTKFIDLSHGDEFASKKQPPLFEKKEEASVTLTEDGKEVKPFVFERVERPPEQPHSSLAESELAANEAVQRLFAARQPQQPAQPAPVQPVRQQAQPVQQPVRQQLPQQPPVYPQSYSYYNQQPYQQGKPVTRIIRGGAANTGYVERPFDVRPKSKSVVIPNGDEKPVKQPAPEPAKPAPAREDEDIKLYRDEADVKIFTPRRFNRFSEPERPEFSAYIEPSLYEAEEKPERAAKIEEVQIDGQISADEITSGQIPGATPAASAKALNAYRTLTIPNLSSAEKKLEKADFAGVLESMGISRSDGFKSDEEELDADGMPVSHKTQHVMDALFGQPRVSPFLHINLDDDDEG